MQSHPTVALEAEVGWEIKYELNNPPLSPHCPFTHTAGVYKYILIGIWSGSTGWGETTVSSHANTTHRKT